MNDLSPYETRAERRLRYGQNVLAVVAVLIVVAGVLWALWGYGLPDPSTVTR